MMEDKYYFIEQCADKYASLQSLDEQAFLNNADEEELIALLEDEDEIIRASAVDLLGYSKKEEVLKRIFVLLKKDPSRIVRSYCCATIMDIAMTQEGKEEILSRLKECFFKEKSLFVKLAWISDLADCFTEEEYPFLKRIIDKGLMNRNRHFRNHAVNALLAKDDFLNFYTQSFLLELLKKEESKECLYIQKKIVELLQRKERQKCQGHQGDG